MSRDVKIVACQTKLLFRNVVILRYALELLDVIGGCIQSAYFS